MLFVSTVLCNSVKRMIHIMLIQLSATYAHNNYRNTRNYSTTKGRSELGVDS